MRSRSLKWHHEKWGDWCGECLQRRKTQQQGRKPSKFESLHHIKAQSDALISFRTEALVQWFKRTMNVKMDVPFVFLFRRMLISKEYVCMLYVYT